MNDSQLGTLLIALIALALIVGGLWGRYW